MAGIQDEAYQAYDEDDLDFSGADQQKLADFRRRENGLLSGEGYEGTSSGSVSWVLWILLILTVLGKIDNLYKNGKSYNI